LLRLVVKDHPKWELGSFEGWLVLRAHLGPAQQVDSDYRRGVG